MLALVFKEMARDDVIENGVTQKLQALVAIRDVVVMIGSVGESLRREEKNLK